MAALAAQISRCANRLRHTPAKTLWTVLRAAGQAGDPHDRRHLVTAIKLAAYDAERPLAERFELNAQKRRWLNPDLRLHFEPAVHQATLSAREGFIEF